MNAKQRRKDKRYRLKIAREFFEVLDTCLDELESGKYTIEEIREQADDMRRAVLEAV